MTHPAGELATASQHPTLAVVALVVTVVGLYVVVPGALAVWLRWRRRRKLRCCPVCGAAAIREVDCEAISIFAVRARVRCGQCETWRSLDSTPAEQRSHARRLDRDRRRIRGQALRLEARRRSLDVRAFITELQAEIAGADDFLARTCPPRTPTRRPGDARG